MARASLPASVELQSAESLQCAVTAEIRHHKDCVEEVGELIETLKAARENRDFAQENLTMLRASLRYAKARESVGVKKRKRRQRVRALPRTSASASAPADPEVPECSICISSIVVPELAAWLSCGHGFHSGCIDPWITEHGTCPLCRADHSFA